jgi:hypothetical protein
MIIAPDKLRQNTCGIDINIVVALSKSVNRITDTDREPITVIALFDILFSPASEAPITIGNKGSMQGAMTVNIPAKIAIRKKIILLNF